jgi:predicted ester cyclase
MSKTNTQIVQEFIEEVVNKKQYDHFFDYCSQDCVYHVAPYVGLGVNIDDSSGEKVFLKDIVPNSPAVGKLQAKDELVRVKDANNTWETWKVLKEGMWGQGVAGTPLTVTVNRAGKQMDIQMVRGRVEGFDQKQADSLQYMKDYMLKFWPDYKSEIKLILAEGDLVACYTINSGTNLEFHHSAVWDECDIYRLKDGKITEMWGVENNMSEMRQVGYQVIPPVV